MREKVIQSIFESLDLYADLFDACDAKILSKVLGKKNSYTVGHHFWCVLGARESHLRALEKGEWDEFSCSVEYDEVSNKEKLDPALSRSTDALNKYLTRQDIEWTDGRDQLLLDLLEHEVRHQGQLIRYGIYFGLEFPKSWTEKFYIHD